MKKIKWMLLVLAIILAGCTGKDVKITLPIELFGNQKPDFSAIPADQITSSVQNEDGSYTVMIPAEAHKKLLEDLKKTFDMAFEEFYQDEMNCPNLIKIEYNDSYSEFNIRVSSQNLTEPENYLSLIVVMYGMNYQIFNGVEFDESQVIVNYVDDATNNVFDVFDSNELLNNKK